LIIYFSVRYRSGSKADRKQARTPAAQKKKLWVEIWWTIIPLFISLGLFGWGASLYFTVKVPPKDALQIDVVAKQWMWKFQHPEGQREIDFLHVPIGQAIKLNMTSQDVIHSLFIPAFRIKQDVLPNRYTTAWFKATQPGTYHLFCTQYCGTNHSRMRGAVIVMEPAEYQRWLSGSTTNQTLAAAGERVFMQMGCSACHDATSNVRAPLLQGLYGRTVQLYDGRTILADRQYIHDSIMLPQKDIVAGYQTPAPGGGELSIMPAYKGVLSEEQVLQLVAYIQSLGSGETPAEVRK
jgi:cytochrome c oxidase subunit 2